MIKFYYLTFIFNIYCVQIFQLIYIIFHLFFDTNDTIMCVKSLRCVRKIS